MARFFVNRPIVAMVISIITVLLGVVAMSGLPISQYPGDRAADDPGHHDLHRRQRDRRRGVGRDAARAADQRRREHDLHEVDQRQRRHVDAEGLVRGRVEPRHEQRAHAEPRVRGHAADAAVGEELRRLGEEGAGVSAARHLDQVAERHLRQRFLSNYTTININDAIARIQGVGQINLFGGSDYAMRVWLRPDVIGRLGITIPDIANAISPAEPVDAGRPDRRAARRRRHRVHLHRPHPGAPAQRGGVRRTSSCGPTRMAPRSASRTSRASSWGRCSTTPSAATTARRRPSSPSSRFPAPTRSTSPTGSRRRWRS